MGTALHPENPPRMGKLGQRVLAKVVAKLGIERTAGELGVSETMVQRFLDGTMVVPDSLLLKAVDSLEPPSELPVAVRPDLTRPRGQLPK